MTHIDDLRLPPPMRQLLSELIALLSLRGVEACATGGFLRDALLGFEIHDLDISVRADPLELGPELADTFGGNYFPMNADRALVRVLLPEYDFHLDLLPLTGSLEEDLRARDYTVDAMAAPLNEVAAGSVLLTDPTGGLDDLRNRTIRLVSEEALARDPLRLLRGVRLAALLDFAIQPDTSEAIRRNAGLLSEAPSLAHARPERSRRSPSHEPLRVGAPSHKGEVAPVAAERQRDELVQMLRTNRAAQALRLLDELDLLSALLPEAAAMREVEQPKEHHWDVFRHSVAAVEALDMMLSQNEPDSEPEQSLWRELWGQLEWWEGGRDYFLEQLVPNTHRCALLKLAAFLHDVGKPETKTFEESGRMRFFGHHLVGADIAVRALKRLRFSSREVAYVRNIVRAHMRPLQMAQAGAPTRKAIYRFFRDTGGAGIDTLFMSLADHLGTVGPNVELDGWRRHVALVNYIIQKRFADPTIVSPPKLVSGRDLMTEFDLPEGHLLGELLDAIRDAQGAGEVATREEAIELARRHLEGTATPAS
jgi:putative nucleotidyltransferase with HDIG domain